MAFGEAGSITTNSPTTNQPIVVTLGNPLTNPVFALTSTNNGGDPFVLRVTSQTLDINGDTTAFTFIIEEWEYLDGPHGATETINWLAIEAGVHSLPDGRTIEAGTASANHTNTAVSLTGDFNGTTPVVLTSVMSNNGGDTVDSDPLNITASGFNVRLQEEEAQGPHTFETVGWIAIQPGGDVSSGTANSFSGVDENVDILSLSDTFTNVSVLAETQTINGPDTATVIIDSQTNMNVGVFIREEQSDDTELGHIDEDVGIVAFEIGAIACFTQGTRIQTPEGSTAIEYLKPGAQVSILSSCDKRREVAPILRVLRRHLSSQDLSISPKLRPICIRAGALGHNLPKRDLLVSPQHRMLISSRIAERMFGISSVLVPAVKLVGLPGITIDMSVSKITYFHLVLDEHQIVFAEGAPSESFFAGPEALNTLTPAGRDELKTLFPALDNSPRYPLPARKIAAGKRRQRLLSRHSNARKPLLETFISC